MASLNYRGGGPLGYQNAYHLLRRATYKVTKERINQFAALTANQAMNQLFNYDSFNFDELIDDQPKDGSGNNIITNGPENTSSTAAEHFHFVLNWYLNEANHSNSIRFKLAFFLHSIFINYLPNYPKTPFDQLKLFLYYSKESYKTLAKKITFDNRMLMYLNGNLSSANNPNENYAREFLELFTITKGQQTGDGAYANYTEEDVIAAKYVFTGLRYAGRDTIDPETGIPRTIVVPHLHDSGPKTFSDRFGGQTIQGGSTEEGIINEISDFVEMVFAQDATAIALSERLYRYFVHREISEEVKNDIIIPLAQIIKNNGYNLEIGVRKLLTSLHFYDEDNTPGDQNIGALIKTPFDLFFHTVNLFKISIPNITSNRLDSYRFYIYFAKNRFLTNSSLDLFKPATVAGYPPIYQEPEYDKQWLTVNTLTYRYGLGQSFIDNRDRVANTGIIINAQFNALDFLQNSGYFTTILNSLYSNPVGNANTAMPLLMQEIEKIAFTKPLSSQRYNEIYNDFLLGNLSEINWAMEWKNYRDGVTNGEDIRTSMNNVFREILNSPEYQIM